MVNPKVEAFLGVKSTPILGNLTSRAVEGLVLVGLFLPEGELDLVGEGVLELRRLSFLGDNGILEDMVWWIAGSRK